MVIPTIAPITLLYSLLESMNDLWVGFRCRDGTLTYKNEAIINILIVRNVLGRLVSIMMRLVILKSLVTLPLIMLAVSLLG